jgi:uncharacterized repeat protein (TIGR03803 family)
MKMNLLLLTLLSSFILHPSSLAHAQSSAVLTTLHSFTGTNDGANPQAALVQGSDGYFYGTTSGGGPYTNKFGAGYGTVFKIAPNGVLTTLYSFTGGNDGGNPSAGLVQGNDGYFYGTTSDGGATNYDPNTGYYGFGTVFKISTNGTLTTLYSFTGGNDGATPAAGLVQGNDGYFYGTTSGVGEYGYVTQVGTVFKISTNGALTSLCSFPSAYPTDLTPAVGLVQGSDGSFYGTTSLTQEEINDFLYGEGGGGGKSLRYSYGAVFQISTNGALTTLYSFTGGNDGAWPVAGLVQGSDGNFYGTTANSGTNGGGTVFNISTTGVPTTLYSFTGGNDGGHPYAGLVQASDGYFYGTTSSGGKTNQYGSGTVFKIGINGTLTTLYSFTGGNDGGGPSGLVQGNDGNFYGTTSGGGAGGAGTVFRLTIVPEFQAVSMTNGTLSLTWSTEAGGIYQLQYSSDLTSTNWTNLGTPIPATGASLTATDSLTNGPQRFYRLVLLP